MSTRSYICKELATTKDDGKVLGLYCHSDGYLTYNGALLVDCYKEAEKVDKLMALGNISCLAERVDPNPLYPHGFDYNRRQDGVVVAYGRDRGEKEQEAKPIELKALAEDPWIEYTYIYGLDGKWRYFEGSDYLYDQSLVEVNTALNNWFASQGIERPIGLYGFYDDNAISIIKEEQEKQKNKNK